MLIELLKIWPFEWQELENLTHMEAPFVGTEDKKEIPYELSFYRGTEF